MFNTAFSNGNGMQGDFPREWKIDLSGVFPGIWRRGKGVLFIGWTGW